MTIISDMCFDERQKLFCNPTAYFRTKPFWAWNGKLDKDELIRQIQIFKEMGFGGFFMHSRTGLSTQYLSEEWFSMVRACVEESKKMGMEAWLYDEDRWPSGYAGGFVTKNPDYQLHLTGLEIFDIDEFKWEKSPDIYVFAAEIKDNKLKSYNRILTSEELCKVDSSRKILKFTIKPQDNKSWYNGYPYLDALNKKAVHEFINVTHEAYKDRFGEYFGNIIPGIFTDEPFRGALFRDFDIWGERTAIPWTNGLPEFCKDSFGYDLTNFLPEIFLDFCDGRYSYARYGYHRCLTMLFVDAFPRQIGQWCEENSLKLTGHILEEDSICRQISSVGSAMQFYSHMQIPGVDVLQRDTIIYIPLKQCVSVARQMGKEMVLSELYGCTGWDTTFETYKHNGDWQAVMGITLRCPHLSWYTMAGESKRDYPASIHFHSLWYKHYHYLEDYFSRINMLLTEGRPICDIAVIHPVESFYFRFHQYWDTDKSLQQTEKKFSDMVNKLIGAHLDFDFIDEQLLIDNPKKIAVDDKGPYLQTGDMKYRKIVVPGAITLRADTLEALNAYHDIGGEVMFIERLPVMIDGKIDGSVEKFAEDKKINLEDLSGLLEDKCRVVSIRDESGNEISDIICQLRESEKGLILFMANINREKSYESINVEILTEFKGLLQYWDAKTGQIYRFDAQCLKDRVSFKVNLYPGGSAMFRFVKDEEALPLWNDYRLEPISEIGSENWSYSLDDYNVLVLDRADCTANDDKNRVFSCEQLEIIYLDDKIRGFLDLPIRGWSMNQPWVVNNQPLGNTAEMKLRYTFEVESIPLDDIKLAIEQPENWQITLNNKQIESTPTGWWVDSAIKTLNISKDILCRGTNFIELKGTFDRKTNLEIIYILGDFGARTDGLVNYIIDRPLELKIGNWTEQGLAFYSGNVEYETNFQFHKEAGQKYFIKITDFVASAAQIRVNDEEPVFLGWAPYEVNVTDAIIDGSNRISIRLFGSRRNSFGPLHVPGNPKCVTPLSYKREDKEVPWKEEYQLAEYGLMGNPIICLAK